MIGNLFRGLGLILSSLFTLAMYCFAASVGVAVLVGAFLLQLLLTGALAMVAWNACVPALFALPLIGLWQAMMLVLLSRCILKQKVL